jgi:hypothetical protein
MGRIDDQWIKRLFVDGCCRRLEDFEHFQVNCIIVD